MLETEQRLAWEMKTLEGPALRRSPCFHKFYYQVPHQVLKVKIGEKSTHALKGRGWLGGGEQGRSHFEICSELSVLNKGLPSRKSVLPICNQHGLHQSLTRMDGEREIPISSPLCTSCLTQGGGELKSTGGYGQRS